MRISFARLDSAWCCSASPKPPWRACDARAGAAGRRAARRPLSVPGRPAAALPAAVPASRTPGALRTASANSARRRSIPRARPRRAAPTSAPTTQDHGVRRLDGRLARLRAGGSVRRDARDRHPAQAPHQYRPDPRRDTRRILRLAGAGARDAQRREAGLRRDDDRARATGAASARRSGAARASAGRAEAGARASRRRRSPRNRRSRQAAAPATPAPQPAPAKPADAEAPRRTPRRSRAGAGPAEHHARRKARSPARWCTNSARRNGASFMRKRVDEMIGVLKAKGVPVFWVGLPSVRGSRATSEMVYLNDLYRGRAEKAGVTYVDIWDGFVDDAGNYSNYGPDFEGQTRRLRSGDGVHFTRAGARKLAHYVEREIRRVMLARAAPVATPLPQEPEPDAKAPPTAAAPGPAAAPDRKPGDVADRAEGRGRCAARRRAAARNAGGFGRDARAGEGRADRGAGRPRRRFRLAAPRRRHGDRRAAARSGRAAAAGSSPRSRAAPARTGRCAAREAGSRAAPAPRAAAARPAGGWGWFGQQQPYEAPRRRISAASSAGGSAADGGEERRQAKSGTGSPSGRRDQSRSSAVLPRQVRRAHQELVDRVRGLAAFADRPHHQRLAAAHVAGGEDLRVRGLVRRRCRPSRCRAGRARARAS